MSPRDRDHCCGGKSSLKIENFGTGMQSASPDRLGLGSFRDAVPDHTQPELAKSGFIRVHPVRQDKPG
jgi:hypothetical protein